MKTHRVFFDVDKAGKFKYNLPKLVVNRKDKIVWKCRKKYPFGLVIKAARSPLNWSGRVAQAGGQITAAVRMNAAPGRYRYAVTIHDGKRLRMNDPDIILKPPEGKGK